MSCLITYPQYFFNLPLPLPRLVDLRAYFKMKPFNHVKNDQNSQKKNKKIPNFAIKMIYIPCIVFHYRRFNQLRMHKICTGHSFRTSRGPLGFLPRCDTVQTGMASMCSKLGNIYRDSMHYSILPILPANAAPMVQVSFPIGI